MTSYYWHLTWGAILAALCRWAEPRMKALAGPGSPLRFARLALAFPVAGATMALGRGAFLPFDLLVPLGVPDGAIVVAALVLSLALLAFGRRSPAGGERGSDRLVLWIPYAFFAFHLLVALSLRGRVADWGGKLAVVLVASAFGVGLTYYAATRPATPGT